MAGAREPSSRLLQQFVVDEGGKPVSQALGTALVLAARQAAMVNGAAGHAMDFDDMGLGGSHPSVAILPAVLALAEKHHLGGAQFAEALLAGYQALARISYACGRSGYQRGFHTTGTVGTLGAAIGCAKLLGLDRDGYINALGLAATQAAGLKVNFGTMAKHLNAGKAAANGVLAAELADEGYTAAGDALEGHQGFVGPTAAWTISMPTGPTACSTDTMQSPNCCSKPTPPVVAHMRPSNRSAKRSPIYPLTSPPSSGST